MTKSSTTSRPPFSSSAPKRSADRPRVMRVVRHCRCQSNDQQCAGAIFRCLEPAPAHTPSRPPIGYPRIGWSGGGVGWCRINQKCASNISSTKDAILTIPKLGGRPCILTMTAGNEWCGHSTIVSFEKNPSEASPNGARRCRYKHLGHGGKSLC